MAPTHPAGLHPGGLLGLSLTGSSILSSVLTELGLVALTVPSLWGLLRFMWTHKVGAACRDMFQSMRQVFFSSRKIGGTGA